MKILDTDFLKTYMPLIMYDNIIFGVCATQKSSKRLIFVVNE